VRAEIDTDEPIPINASPADLLRHVDTAICSVDSRGTFCTMAEAIERITGFPAATYLGTPLGTHVHPDDLDRATAEFMRLRDDPDGARRSFRVRSPSLDGGWRWIDVVATRRLDDPALRCIVASVRDVEDEQVGAQRRRAADAEARLSIEQLQQKETFLQSVIEASADAVLITDDDLVITWASPSVEAFSGWTAAQLTGKSVTGYLHPDDLDAALSSAMRLVEEGDKGTPAVECRVRMADGAHRWVRVDGRNLSDVPDVQGVVIVLTDIHEVTEARRALAASERRFEALVANSHDCIIVTDATGAPMYVSPAVTRTLGWDIELVRQAPFAAGMPEPERQELLAAMDSAIADPSRPQRVECRMPHIDGGYRWMELVLWSRLDDPEVGGIISNFRDITEQRRLVAELEERTEVLRSLAFSSTTGLFEQDSVRGNTFVNERWVEITGMPAHQAMGDGWMGMLVGSSREAVVQPAQAEVGQEPVRRLRIRRPDGERRWIDVRSAVLPSGADGVMRRLGGIEDVTATVEAELALHRLADVFDSTDDLVILVDTEGTPLYSNQAARELLGDDLHRLVGLEALAEVADSVSRAFYEEGLDRWSGEVTIEHPDGRRVPMSVKVIAHPGPDSDVAYMSAVARDITERIALQGSLERQATHDPLTGLPNRSLLLERIRRACDGNEARGADPSLALLFVDLDHFKVINDSLGHGLGDRLLQAIAERILTVTRPGDTVARFGGDEFVVLCERLDAADDALRVAHRLETTLQAPFVVDGHEIHVGVSIGIAFAEDGDIDPVAILRDADTAMYEAKSAGRGRWVVFDEQLRRRAVDRQRTESALRQSRNGENLHLHYQPVLDLRTGTIRSVEALLRWERDGEFVAPAQFVLVAEETGLIVPIGAWVLEEACRQAAQWQRTPGWADLGVAVNVSARQLQRPGFLSTVSDLLASCGLAPGSLTLEITESVLLDDTATIVSALESLRDLGVHVAVDDFGTGYSSLTYLHRLPVDTVKLDQSFVAGVADDPQKRAIVTAVINLAKALGLNSVAEGIETERQMAELRMLGCDAGQGHLISEAVDAAAITRMLEHGFTH